MAQKNSSILTKKQNRVYGYIHDYIEKNSVSPTVTELAAFLGVSSLRTVTQYLDALQKKQLISRARHQSRGISLVSREDSSQTVTLPVLSSAGCDNMEVFAQQTFDEYVTVDRSFLKNKKVENVFIFKAVGDSMADAGIATGDLVLTEKTSDICDKDKVVAVVDGMAVIKQIFFSPNATVLRPMSKNKKYRPIIMKKDFPVFGKVLDVIKNFTSEEELVYENL